MPSGQHGHPDAPAREARREAGRWLALSVGSLVLAGAFAILLVIGRTPPLDRLFSDPLFFKRGLVVHVDLALVVWFYSFVAAITFLVPSRRAPGRLARAGASIAAAGVVAMMAGAGMRGAAPVLANYIPVIDHPAHNLGLLAFFLGVALAVLDPRLLPSHEAPTGFFALPPAARPPARAAALALVLALLAGVGAFLTTPRGLPAQGYYELLFWGMGHALQFASVLGMVAVWMVLLESALGRAPVSRRASAILSGLLLAPVFAAPSLTLSGTTRGFVHSAFTTMMRWGIFPVVSVFLVAGVLAVVRARRAGGLPSAGLADPRIMGFAVSAALTALGFGLGAAIRGSNTMIPAHYHASIGAVTAAFMAVGLGILESLGHGIPTPRLRRWAGWQPLVFGGGQMVFAAGFALAGSHGMARKVYGQEQDARSLGEIVGLGTMGLGGLVAAAGGLLFLYLVLSAWRRPASAPSAPQNWRHPWNDREIALTRSRG
ncbi:hypothetical protein L6R50_12950 [Myxococcota bacterium]|nr:hypothetical protein [Myxococcota bacterium]